MDTQRLPHNVHRLVHTRLVPTCNWLCPQHCGLRATQGDAFRIAQTAFSNVSFKNAPITTTQSLSYKQCVCKISRVASLSARPLHQTYEVSGHYLQNMMGTKLAINEILNNYSVVRLPKECISISYDSYNKQTNIRLNRLVRL
jgi:hypothetical protein